MTSNLPSDSEERTAEERIEGVELLISLWRGPLIVRRGATMAGIAQEVADEFGVTIEQLRGRGTARWISVPRQEAMRRIRQRLGKSTTQIGRFFNRDHSTVIYACRATPHSSHNVPVEDRRSCFGQFTEPS